MERSGGDPNSEENKFRTKRKLPTGKLPSGSVESYWENHLSLKSLINSNFFPTKISEVKVWVFLIQRPS